MVSTRKSQSTGCRILLRCGEPDDAGIPGGAVDELTLDKVPDRAYGIDFGASLNAAVSVSCVFENHIQRNRAGTIVTRHKREAFKRSRHIKVAVDTQPCFDR